VIALSCIKIVNGHLVLENRGSVVGSVEKSQNSDLWSFYPVEGNPYNIQHADRGNGALHSALTAALKYNPYT
jgi:hypothetical protein